MEVGIVTRLDGIRARAEAATPGPWFREYGDVVTSGPDPYDVEAGCDEPRHVRIVRRAAHLHQRNMQGINDASFIAHAREDVPALLAALDAVLALHKRTCEMSGENCKADDCPMMVCGACGEDHPCPTVAAVSAALGGGE